MFRSRYILKTRNVTFYGFHLIQFKNILNLFIFVTILIAAILRSFYLFIESKQNIDKYEKKNNELTVLESTVFLEEY